MTAVRRQRERHATVRALGRDARGADFWRMAKLCRSVCIDTRLSMPSRERRLMDRPIEFARGGRIERIHPGEQPPAVGHLPLRPGDPPPSAQPFEQGHPLAVDVDDLQRHHLAGAQARAVRHRQRRLHLQVACRGNQTRRLVPTQHHRQRPWYLWDGGDHDRGPPQWERMMAGKTRSYDAFRSARLSSVACATSARLFP